MLEAEDFETLAAANGRIGVYLAICEVPDLILCDLMMPEIDGYGVLTALRQDPSTATIPFIFLTAKSAKSDFRQGMDVGADDYNVANDPQKSAITKALIQMAHNLNLDVIAEGVETEAELDFLRQHNCNSMQGFLYSRPLPAAEFEKLLLTKKCLYV